MAYAEKTTVSVAKTRADIEDLIIRYGADQFISGFKENLAIIGFTMENRQIKFLLPLPDKTLPSFVRRLRPDILRAWYKNTCWTIRTAAW